MNDSVSSEDPRLAENHNRIERLRDPSHGRMLPPSEVIGLFRRVPVDIVQVRAHRYRRDLEEFLDIAGPETRARDEITRFFRAWTSRDESGLLVRREGGRIVFDHTQWTILGIRR